MLNGSSARRRAAGPLGAIWLPSPAPGPSRTASGDTPDAVRVTPSGAARDRVRRSNRRRPARG